MNSKRMTFHLQEDGIYAVIFSPKESIYHFKREVYCGLVCRDKRLIFVMFFIVIPIMAMTIYFVYYVYEQKLEDDNLTIQKNFLVKKLEQVEEVNKDFKGQTLFEKIEEGVVFFANPMRSQDESENNKIIELNQRKEALIRKKQELLNQKQNLIQKNNKLFQEVAEFKNRLNDIDFSSDEDY